MAPHQPHSQLRPGFRHGCRADLERSLELAGEKQEDYDAHRELFQQAFHPRDDDERNLVEGAAQAVWRRLRALRAHQMAEFLRLCVLLASLQAGTLAQRRQRFRAEVTVALGGALLWEPMKKLHQRLEHIFRALVEPETHEFRFVGRRCERMEQAMRGWAAEVVGNPYRRAPILERHEAWVRPVEEWREWGTGAGNSSWSDLGLNHGDDLRRGVERLAQSVCGSDPAAAGWENLGLAAEVPGSNALLYEVGQGPSYQLRRVLAEQEQELGRSALPQDLDEFTRLMERSLGEGEDVRKLAELVWERVTWFQRRAEQEAQELDELLSEAGKLKERIERAAADLEAGRPVNIAPPTPREQLEGKSAYELIGLLLENELEERIGKQRSVVEAMEAVRRQEGGRRSQKPKAKSQKAGARNQEPESPDNPEC